MSMETYTVEIAETESNEGISADVYDADGLVAESTHVAYADYGVAAVRDDWEPDVVEREFTADVTTLDMQVSRGNDEFEFRLLGDREELLRERLTDSDLQLAYVDGE
ncbi:hypothetical protein SAMN04487948_102223 [Halogranum amylolyticum]|uniref:Uncharacterized protein n=1 Tax=Halogranum amylolyticum TaxID=660520 RepID=A0A1H8PCM5_9EURY|nr:hypothetical protein [Halogranum amylolyticum]SEO39576.1 hypothetical protein SAMN04487948_102223 [Halogranum amylolyticum]